MPFPTLAHQLLVSWGAAPATGVDRWEVYAFKGDTPPELRDSPGECIAHACAAARSVKVELPEGEYVVQVLPRSLGGQLAPFQKAHWVRYFVGQVQPRDVGAPRNPVAGVVDMRLAGLVTMDPRQFGDDVDRVEIIEGPSAQRGVLVARVDAPEDELAARDRGVRASAPPFPLAGHGFGDSRLLTVRAISRDGRAGAATSFPAIRPLPPGLAALEIASVVGTTRNNVPAPAATAGYELDASDGIRLKAMPLSQDATAANWGALSATLLNISSLAKYVPEVTIETDEVDLGHKLLFALDCWADLRRKSSTAPSILSRHGYFPSAPQLRPELEGSAVTPAWFAKEILSNGTPRNPLPPPYFEVKWGDASPIVMLYQPWTPGLMIAARYVRVRVTFRDPTGMFQMIAPKLYARALVPIRTYAGQGTVPGSQASVTVQIENDPVTGVSPLQNVMSVQLTPRTADRSLHHSKSPTASPPEFEVTHRTIGASPATPGTDTDFDYVVTGY